MLYSSFSFCTFQLDNIHHHHTLEETFYFPAMEEKLGKGVLSGNIKEHEEFVPKLEALDEWCKKVQKGAVVYDGTVFLGMVDAFADTMVAHMTHVRSILFCNSFKLLPDQ
jgi:hemerythrin-like domain-containing protein